MEPRNRCQGINSASLCSMAGRYDNPIPTRCLAPIDFLIIPAEHAAANFPTIARVPYSCQCSYCRRHPCCCWFCKVAVIPAIASFSTVVQTSKHNCYCRHCCSACWLPNHCKISLLLLVLLLQEASLLLLALLLLLSFLLLLWFPYCC
jgi:hypothetical protein